MSILNRLVDERFLAHRRRSTSNAGIASAVAAWGLFMYRFYWRHVWSWDLFVVFMTFLGLKLTLMAWYFLTD